MAWDDTSSAADAGAGAPKAAQIPASKLRAFSSSMGAYIAQNILMLPKGKKRRPS